MKKVLACMLLGASSTAMAGDWYGTVEYSRLDTELSVPGFSSDTDPDALNFKVGKMLHENFAIEGLVGVRYSDDSVEGAFDFEMSSLIGVNAVGVLPLSDSFNLFAKVGLVDIDYNDSDRDKSSATGASFGAGVDVNFTDNVGLTLEYVQYPDGEYDDLPVDVESSAVNFGVKYSF